MANRLGNLPRDTRDTLFLLGVIAWVVLPQIDHLPLWCSALAGAVLVWRGVLAWRSQPLPPRWWLVGLLVASIAATLFTHRTILGRDAGVTLIVILLALKTLELRAKRDAFVIFFLGFFTMLTNFFFSQSLLTAAAMLIALLGLLTALVMAHMPVGKPPLMQAAKTSLGMAALGAPIMAVLFLLFPRLAPLWGLPGDAMAGRTGLSNSMRVGTIAKLAQDDSIAMRVRFAQKAPPPGTLYYRGPVLSSFDGREWRPLRSAFPAPMQLADNLQVSGPALDYEITLEPNNQPWLLLLDGTKDRPVVPNFEPRMTADLQWVVERPVTDLLRYRATRHTDYTHGPKRMQTGLQDFVDLPPGFNPRTLQLAADLRRRSDLAQADAMTLMQAVLQRLTNDGYAYTLEPGEFGPNTADEFWFDKKEGFCEHIASSFVILMRALDVPARIVTGYQGGELNGVDGFWVVRQSDAHAWAEVWQNGRGWVRVDPTAAVAPSRIGTLTRLEAPKGLIASALGNVNPALTLNLRAAWEAMNNRWNQWVLNYSQTKQLSLLKDIGFKSPSWEDLGLLLVGIIVAVTLCGALWTLWERSRHDPWLALLAQAAKRTEKSGVPLPPQCPPRDMGERLARHFASAPQSTHAARDWLLRLEAWRYAVPEPAHDRSRTNMPLNSAMNSPLNNPLNTPMNKALSRPRQGQHNAHQNASARASLAALKREFKQLNWPA